MSEFSQFFRQIKAGGLESVGIYLGLYRGEVVEVYEGDGEGRVSIKVPRISASALPPARPLLAFCDAAGEQKFAAHFGPKVGDRVIVMFEDGDPKIPWYVGGWASANGLPSELIAGAAGFETRGLVLRDGTKVLFREAGGVVDVVTPSGAAITAGNGRVTATDGAGATATLEGGVVTLSGDTVKLAGDSNRSILGDAFRQWLMTEFSLPSPLGPLGPIPVVPETFLSDKVKLD